MTTPAESEPTARDTWSAQAYNTTASFVYSPANTAPVLALLAAQPGERILDLGCGSGELTLMLQATVGASGRVVGVDASANMLERARANGLAHCVLADAQALRLPPAHAAPYDAVFSSAALHWCKRDPSGAVRGAAVALRPGGRFVGEFGGFANCGGVRAVIHHVLRTRGYDPVALDPWYFPSVQAYRSRLEGNGFRVEHISLNPRLTPLKGGLVDWFHVFGRASFLADVADPEADEIMQEIEDMCAVDYRDESGNWVLMYTRLRFVAILE